MKFSQIIYGSTEKSIVSGRSGFGVRTMSADLDGNAAEAINQAMRLNMNVPQRLRPTLEQMRTEPERLAHVPHAFSFRPVDGNRYAAGRAVYIAADYGVFSGDEAFCRVGSNYLAHTLVTDAPAPREVFRLALAAGLFKPVNTRITPDNDELVALVAGEPAPLPALDVDLDTLREVAVPLDTRLAHIAIALVTAHRNRLAGGNAPQSVMVKARSEDTPELVAALSLLPPQLAQGLAVLTAYNKGGMPTDVNLVMVDETCDDIPSDEYNITVNMMEAVDGNGHYPCTNIAFDMLDDRLIAIAADEQDETTFERFVELMLATDVATADLPMVIKLFYLTRTNRGIALSDLDGDNMDKLLEGIRSLPADGADVAWEKVNTLLNDILEDAVAAPRSRLATAMRAIARLRRAEPARLHVSDAARESVRDLAFDSDSPQLAQLTGSGGAQLLTWLIDPVERVPYHMLENALMTVSDAATWRDVLRCHYGDALAAQTATVVPMVLRSTVAEPAALIAGCCGNGRDVTEAALMAAGSDDDRVAKRVAALVATQINAWHDNGLPTDDDFATLERIEAAALPLPAATAARMATLLAIKRGQQPDKVSRHAIKLAARLQRDNAYLDSLADAFAAANPLHDDVTALTNSLLVRGDTRLAASLLAAEWLHRKKNSRRDVMLSVLDGVKWSDRQRHDVIKAVQSKAAAEPDLRDLADCIDDSNSLMSRFKRALRNFFGR